jgi:choline transport protein
MARDRAFPYSEYFAKVNKTFGIPFRAMLAIVVIDLIIGQFIKTSCMLSLLMVKSARGKLLQMNNLINLLNCKQERTDAI